MQIEFGERDCNSSLPSDVSISLRFNCYYYDLFLLWLDCSYYFDLMSGRQRSEAARLTQMLDEAVRELQSQQGEQVRQREVEEGLRRQLGEAMEENERLRGKVR
ncbi:unnamed protein product [Sphagnum balticum]